MQVKLTAIGDAANSKAVHAGTTVRSIGVDNTLGIVEASNVTNLAVGKEKIQVKFTAIGDATNSKAVLAGTTVKKHMS